jgi:RNA polymerase sigma-70 factor (ECF subfamily)
MTNDSGEVKPGDGGEDHEITLILRQLRERPELFNEKLLPLLHKQMRKMAGSHMRKEAPGHTLQPTALVNEAFMQLAKSHMDWESRAHFFASASTVMRNFMIDYARRKGATVHGGQHKREELVDVAAPPKMSMEMLIAIDTAMERLKAVDPKQERVIHLRFFAGLTIEETAEVMGIGLTSAKKYDRSARAWLKRELAGKEKPGGKA